MADYEFHMSTIKEWVYDSLKTVTYKYLAHHMNVSSNYAKQMLFEFAQRNKNNVHTIYFVSGLLKSDGSLHMRVVPESKLVDAERKLGTITSKHVYSVSSTALSDSAQLWAADRELPPVASSTSTDEWDTIHETSAISCSNIERRAKAPKPQVSLPPPIAKKTLSASAISREPSLVKQASSTSDSAKEEKKEDAPVTAATAKAGAKKGGIMGMFAASAAKSTPSKSTTPKTTTAAPIVAKAEHPTPATAPASTHGKATDELNEDHAQPQETPTKAKSEAKSPKKKTPAKSPKQDDPSTTEEAEHPSLSGKKSASKSPNDKTETAKRSGKAKTPPKKSASSAQKGSEQPKLDAFAKSGKPKDVVVEKMEETEDVKANAMDVDIVPAASPEKPVKPVQSAPKSFEDDILEDLEMDEDADHGLSKLKKNVAKDDEVFDSDEDPFGASSKTSEVARAKKKEEAKQKARKEAAEARKKAKAEAKAAEAEANKMNVEEPGEEKKKKRRKRESGLESDEEKPEPVITEQRRRFDAYFGASQPATTHTTAMDTSQTAVPSSSMPSFDIAKTRTKKLVETETYVNEKGYTVTREIVRDVEEEIPEEERQKMREDAEKNFKRQQEAEEARKVQEAKKAAAKAKAAAAKTVDPVGGAAKKGSIASFFLKKS